MRKIIPLLLFFSLSAAGYCQPTGMVHPVPTIDYLKKSKQRQRAGTILLIASPILVFAPLAIVSGIEHGGDATMGIITSTMAMGFLAFPVSMGFFISSYHAKKKAMALGLTRNTLPSFPGQKRWNAGLPGLTLKLQL